jgi:hypothetical protein
MMEKELSKRQNAAEKTVYLRDQLVTKLDLEEFRLQLLEDLKKLLPSQHIATQKQWLKGSEVRKLLGISPGKLQTLRISGKLVSSLVGSVHYYKYESIQKLMEP